MLSASPRFRAYAMLGLVMLFWAGNSIIGRAVRDDIPPLLLALIRWTGALIVLAPFALRATIRDWPEIRRNWRPVLLLGLVGVGAFNALLYSGLQHTTASNGMLMQALIPALVLVVGAISFGDRAPMGQIVGVVLSTIGVAAIVFRGDPHAILQLRLGFGDALIVIACVCWAIYTACLRLRPAIQPESFVFVTFAIAALAMVPLAASEASEIAAMRWTPPVLGAFAYVAVFPSVIAYFLYNAAVTQIGGGAAGQTIGLMPLLGAFLAAGLLGEQLHAYHFTGMALILGGIALSWVSARASPERQDRGGGVT